MKLNPLCNKGILIHPTRRGGKNIQGQPFNSWQSHCGQEAKLRHTAGLAGARSTVISERQSLTIKNRRDYTVYSTTQWRSPLPIVTPLSFIISAYNNSNSIIIALSSYDYNNTPAASQRRQGALPCSLYSI